MQTCPLVSVIIPTYNRVTYLREAIQSVMCQSYPNYEILVVNDGSTDETAAYLSELTGPVRVFNLGHSGYPSISRNLALSEAIGGWVAFLDDDDLWLPEKLTRQIVITERDPRVGFVYGNLQLLFEDGTLSDPVFATSNGREGTILDALIEECFIHPSTLLAKRELVIQVGGFDEQLNIVEDYDLCLRLAQFTTAGFESEPTVRVRRHSGEISITRKLNIHLNSTLIFRRLLEAHRFTPKQKFRIRTATARRYTHAGLLYMSLGRRVDARNHFLASLRALPLQRRAWVELWKCLWQRFFE